MPKNIFTNNGYVVMDNHNYLKRTNLYGLLEDSIQNQAVIVTAAAGYGKTQAVYNFLQEYNAETTWQQLTALDNMSVRFWGNFVNVLSLISQQLASDLEMLGFPETPAKFNLFLSYVYEELKSEKKYVFVFDDFHLIHEKKVLQYVEKLINTYIPSLTIILISRNEPEIDIMGLLAKGLLSIIQEQSLRFNEEDMIQYYKNQNVRISPQNIGKIYNITGGWIMAIRLIELSIKNGLAHEEYAIAAMKLNIFRLIENDIYSLVSIEIRAFLAKLSLFDSLPMELVKTLASNDEQLVSSISKINSFIRYDNFSNICCIHHLFLDFLRKKQDILTPDEKAACYRKAADWYALNGYTIDAITYYGKMGAYEEILKIALFFPHASMEEGALVLDILDNAPKEIFEKEPMLSILHARALYFTGKTAECMEEVEMTIKRYEGLPQTQENMTILCELYLTAGLSYFYLCNTTNDFTFSDPIVSAYQCVADKNFSMKINYSIQDVGTYVCRISSEKKEDMEKYIEAVTIASFYSAKMMPGCMCGMDDLSQAELAYLKNNMKDAKKFAYSALYKAREHRQYVVLIRVIFYLLRIYLAECDFMKIQELIQQLDLLLKTVYTPTYKTLYDITTGWFYSLIGQNDKVANWIKGNFEQVGLNLFAPGTENLAMVRYYLCNKKYSELLGFVESRESVGDIKSFIFGKVAIATTKAVCLYHTEQKGESLKALEEAYLLAKPNELIMQFVEFGNDMVSLTKFALKNEGCKIPEDWLRNIFKKSSTYAKRLSEVALEYKRVYSLETPLMPKLTQKELNLLSDLCHGMSRTEIAANYGLSPNYVKNRLQMIYAKLGAVNKNDAIRIAILKKLVN